MPAFSLVELLVVVGLGATLASLAVPQLDGAMEEFRAAGAARHVASRLQQARMRAVTRSRDTALRIARDAAGYVLSVYEDGNRNGVLSRDIQDGIDMPIGATERLSDRFTGIDFGALPGIPGAEGSVAPGSDPIRLGVADSVTFTSLGTATAGSLYVRGRRGAQYVVRIYGETGRTRILRYNGATGTWLAR